jgi:hypothetical protein
MKVLRPLFMLILVEISLCGLLIFELSNAAEFTADYMLPSAIQMLAFFIGILCVLLFIDGLLYMHRMNNALNNTARPLPVYQHDPMLEAMDVIDTDMLPAAARYAQRPKNADDVAA